MATGKTFERFCKKVNIGLLLLIIILVLSSNALGQIAGRAVTCIKIDPLHQWCFENKPSFNTTDPAIRVDYTNLLPMTLISYRLHRWNGSDQPLTYQGTPAVGLFNFTSPIPQPDGKYEFIIVANTLYGVNTDTHVNFTINGTSMGIWVISPRNDIVDKPNFAFGNNITFPLVLGLERAGTCRFYIGQTLVPGSNLSGLFQAWSFRPLTPSANHLQASIQNFDMRNYAGAGYPYDGSDNPLYQMQIICQEDRDPSRYTYDVIYIGSDTTIPSINTRGIPNPIFDGNNPVSNVTITSNDLSVCTLDNVDPGTGATYTYVPGYPFTGLEDFKRLIGDNVLITDPSRNNYTFKFNVSCENLANLKNTKEFDLAIDATFTQRIDILSPPALTNQPSTQIIAASRLPDTCSFRTNSSQQFTSFAQNSADLLNHSSSVILADGQYLLEVQCTRAANMTAQLMFRVDKTPPGAPNIVANSYSCSLSQVHFTISGNDTAGGSGIAYFIYNVTLSGDASGTYDFSGQTSGSVTKNIDGTPIDGKTYIILSRGVDNAGNIGYSVSQKNIVVSNDTVMQCDFIPPQAILRNWTFNNATKEALIYVDCQDDESGCKGTFDFSIHENDTACTFNMRGKNLMDPIRISRTSKVCYMVYDKNNNNDSDSRIFQVTVNGTTIVPPHCLNNRTDLDETGLDCGGKDCRACTPLHCFNNRTDSSETGVDCGGSDCKACALNQTCKVPQDCDSLYCSSGICKLPSCFDNITNGMETDVDCGGTACKACAFNSTCISDTDCGAGNCNHTTCQVATCTDGKKDGQETDADCGGPECKACETSYLCQSNADCKTNYCNLQTKKCEEQKIPPRNETTGGTKSYDCNSDGIPDSALPCEEITKTAKKSNPLATILMILGIICMLGGAGLLVYEGQQKKKVAKSKPLQQVANVLKEIPKPVIIKPQRELTPDERKLQEKLRQKAYKARQQRRRSILDEFKTGDSESGGISRSDVAKEFNVTKQPAAEQAKAAKPAEKPADQKAVPKAEPKKKPAEEDPFEKLKKFNKAARKRRK